MTGRRSIGIGLAVAVMLGGAASAPARAQNAVYAYPMAGQSLDQQQKDNWECHNWSVQQTGYDPQRPPPAPGVGYASPPPPQSSGGLGSGQAGQGGVVRDAAAGALGGAIIGGIAGDAGKGAAIGAVTTTLFGGIKRRNRQQEEEQWRQQQYQQQQYQQQQYQQQVQAMSQNFYRAFAACMSARDYQVQ